MRPHRITDGQAPGLCPVAARPVVHVVTWFYERQPGLAIYTARLQALMKHADVVVCAGTFAMSGGWACR